MNRKIWIIGIKKKVKPNDQEKVHERKKGPEEYNNYILWSNYDSAAIVVFEYSLYIESTNVFL